MEQGKNYDVIRRRLSAAADGLAEGLESINDERKRVFGGSEIEVIGSERVRTEHNCVPRDIVTVGDLLLFGYNVFIGLKQETTVADVFGLHRFEKTADGYDCSAVPLDSAGGFLLDPQFVKDFGNLYRYYREAKLLQLVTSGTQLLAVFQSGASHRETKVFRWRIEGSGDYVYVDDRGERDYAFERSHDFEWTQVTREQQESGRFPHYNIEDEVFVDVLGGSLTIKVENNTETGVGIYSEPVDDPNQVLDDGQFSYAALGSLLVLKVLPFRETTWRYLVYDRRHRRVTRIDAIGQACHQLPEDHGIAFPGGYFLQSGERKVFDTDTAGLEFVRALRAPNGEDVLYVYHRRSDGHYALLFYNLIRKQATTPIECHGYSLFGNGQMTVFRALTDEPTRVHPMQVWATPFSSVEYAASAATDDSFLAKVGNADLVRGISDGFSVVRLARTSEPTRETFEDIVSASERIGDNYYWLASAELASLSESLGLVGRAAEQIVDEFEKVLALREQASARLASAESEVNALEQRLAGESWARIDVFLEALTSLRRQRGHLITAKEIRFIDGEAIETLEARVGAAFERVSRDAVNFLLREDAFEPLNRELEETLTALEAADTVANVSPLRDKIEETSEGLALLGEVVASIEIDDVTQRTAILERITEIFAHVNAARATVEGRYRELLTREGKAEFGAQLMMLSQAMSSAIAMTDTPEACDEQMARIVVSLEELESRFSDVDEFVGELADKREDIREAFASRKQVLLEARQRRAQTLLVAGERILDGIARRARLLEDADDLNGFFAADAMVMKLRHLSEELATLGDPVKADELANRLSAAKQTALRTVRDRIELSGDSDSLIRLGNHKFSVNRQPLELTLVPSADSMALHLTGTDFYETVLDGGFSSTRPFWNQPLVSETDAVYRAEYLAYQVLRAAERGDGDTAADLLVGDRAIERAVTAYSLERYDEGYERGIHDRDATEILTRLLGALEPIGLLRFTPSARALATLYWVAQSEDEKKHLRRMALSRFSLRERLGVADALEPLATALEPSLRAFAETRPVLSPSDAANAARYLSHELGSNDLRFVASADAAALSGNLFNELELQGLRQRFEDDIRALAERPDAQFNLAYAWTRGHAESRGQFADASIEAATILCTGGLDREAVSARTEVIANGLLGHHPRIRDREMSIRVDEFLARLDRFDSERVPAFRDYRHKRAELIAREDERLRPSELVPRVMTSFVRNQLISDVYLPLIGDNLAKQIGVAGAEARTDLMGLLLLISPPGYGKTTLMEYLADRLGLAFVKINGPSLGHQVRSLDPDEAPNATARAEVTKINLALEMGSNVMLYVDDIQHTHPELLQKFISLCDGQRRIEGVWNGKTSTYDLRGKKFCVVMAGNPYTESGEMFRVPDMLANRADVYNLGDVLSGHEALFAKSYIENALTSNPTLAPLAVRDPGDLDKLIAMCRGDAVGTGELSYGYSQVEIDEITTLLGHLFYAQGVLLKINQLYIRSAAQDDAFRTEPPFKLQGSYRNMNKLAEKIASAMTRDELDQLIDNHYAGEAQTLTAEAEYNLLKLGEMRGRLSDEDRQRYDDIVAEFRRQHRLGGSDSDPMTRMAATLDGVRESLDSIRSSLGDGSNRQLGAQLAQIAASLSRKVEVTVNNEPPDGIKELLAEQTSLVERTLIPVVQAATKNLHDGQAFAQQLLQIFEILQTLEHKIER